MNRLPDRRSQRLRQFGFIRTIEMKDAGPLTKVLWSWLSCFWSDCKRFVLSALELYFLTQSLKNETVKRNELESNLKARLDWGEACPKYWRKKGGLGREKNDQVELKVGSIILTLEGGKHPNGTFRNWFRKQGSLRLGWLSSKIVRQHLFGRRHEELDEM